MLKLPPKCHQHFSDKPEQSVFSGAAEERGTNPSLPRDPAASPYLFPENRRLLFAAR